MSAVREPFPYVTVDRWFDPSFADRLLAWFERDAIWVEQISHFYVQHACMNLRRRHAEVIDELLGRECVGEVQRWFEAMFGCEFGGTHLSVTAHRLAAGEGIGVHTDSPSQGTETHRLVVHLNREFDDSFGGHLLLLAGASLEHLRAIVRPVHNSAVGFELSPHSWHAVNDVCAGERYSLVFALWRAGAECEFEAAHGVQAGDEEPLLDLLCTLRAHEVPHSGRSLLDHLFGTGRLLRRWGYDASVCLAGMAHSLYGTPGFRGALLGVDDRARVRAVIGDRGERLAWLFGRVERIGLELALRSDGGATLSDFEDGSVLRVTRTELEDLAAIGWANTVDQDLALAARGEPWIVEPSFTRRIERSPLSESAKDELRRMYA